jgi:hypothetical protein
MGHCEIPEDVAVEDLMKKLNLHKIMMWDTLVSYIKMFVLLV